MSKLVAFELQDFMSIGEARIEFDDSGILNLVGYNDSGKSAVTRSLEVLFYDAYSSEQVRYIRDGCEFFGVGAEFDDGVSVNKYKYSTGQSVWEMVKDGQVIFTNRLNDGIAAMGDIPDVIANYLGVIKDDSTNEQLNIRRNTDKLFLINTTGGDNYKILNTVLRADVLAESVKRMNEDRNKLQSEVSNLATSSATLKNELQGITVLDEATFNTVLEMYEKLASSKQKVEYLVTLSDLKANLDAIRIYDELPLVDTSRLTSIVQLQELKKATEVVIYDECTTIDTHRLVLLKDIATNREALNIIIPAEVATVDTNRLRELRIIGESYNNLLKVNTDLANVELEHETTLKELKRLSEIHGFKICKTCGTVAS